MVSLLVEHLPSAASDFFHQRARRSGTASVTEQVRHELITMARETAPIDQVVEFVEQNHPNRPGAEVDPDAAALTGTYALPDDVWTTLCRRAAATGAPVSEYVHRELISLSSRSTVDDVMWAFGEYKDANPDSDVDLQAILDATRYARGLD